MGIFDFLSSAASTFASGLQAVALTNPITAPLVISNSAIQQIINPQKTTTETKPAATGTQIVGLSKPSTDREQLSQPLKTNQTTAITPTPTGTTTTTEVKTNTGTVTERYTTTPTTVTRTTISKTAASSPADIIPIAIPPAAADTLKSTAGAAAVPTLLMSNPITAPFALATATASAAPLAGSAYGNSPIPGIIDTSIKNRDQAYDTAGKLIASGNLTSGLATLAAPIVADIALPLDAVNAANLWITGRGDQITPEMWLYAGLDIASILAIPLTAGASLGVKAAIVGGMAGAPIIMGALSGNEAGTTEISANVAPWTKPDKLVFVDKSGTTAYEAVPLDEWNKQRQQNSGNQDTTDWDKLIREILNQPTTQYGYGETPQYSGTTPEDTGTATATASEGTSIFETGETGTAAGAPGTNKIYNSTMIYVAAICIVGGIAYYIYKKKGGKNVNRQSRHND